MSEQPERQPETPERPRAPSMRRGAYWLALFVSGCTFALVTALMTIGRPVEPKFFLLAFQGVAPVVIVTLALTFGLADFGLRRFRRGGVAVYAASCALPSVLVVLAMSIVAPGMAGIFALWVLVPAVVGGAVLGYFRPRQTPA